jgi:hypothetical protein
MPVLIWSLRDGGVASPGDFPHGAREEREPQSLPVVQARRAREVVVHRALVRMPQLVHEERIAIGDPARSQVAPDRVDVRIEIAATVVVPVELVQQHVERDDLERRDDVALVRFAERGGLAIFGANAERGQREDNGQSGFHRPERPAIQAFGSFRRPSRILCNKSQGGMWAK